MNYLFYPTKVMGISQSYLGTFSHQNSFKGKPQSFPIDEACSDTGRDWFYCSCDELLQKACEFNPPNRELAHLSNKVKNAVLDINDAECLLKKLKNKESK